jgi:enterochelin esterase-like enzyme
MVHAGLGLLISTIISASGQSALLQSATEDIAQASGVEFAGSKGGPENNVLVNTDQVARAGKTAFKHWVNQRGERSELRMMKTDISGTYWYGWSMQVPKDFDHRGHKTIVMQLASYPTPRNGKFPCRANGPFMHISPDGKLVLHLQHAGDSTDSQCDAFPVLDDITRTQGQWIDFVMQAKWTGDRDGFVKFWLKVGDGPYEQKMTYAGRTWWNDEDKGPYFKMGAYLGDPNWGGPPEIALYTDEFRMGGEKSSFDEVAPPGPAVRVAKAGKGQILDLRYPSPLNKQDIPIKIYLPPGYETGTERYPVVYNFHGGGGTPERQWDRIHKTLIDAMDNRRVRPMIYVFVNGLGNSEFVNTADGKPIERSIVTELIPFVDQTYRTIANRTGRAADGFSMGGFGCLSVAFKNPELFSAVTSYGAALVIGPTGRNFTDPAHFAQHSPKALTVKNRAQILKNLRIRMVCGDSDWLFTSNTKFKAHLDSLKVPVDWVEVPGLAHCTQCLYEQVGVESLKFMEEAFAASTKGKPMNAPGTWKKRPYPATVAQNNSFGNEPLPFRPAGKLPRLKVSENKRFLVTESGKPFFWLGDTGWMLFSKLDREEVDKYFENRAAQQFSVVLGMLLPWQPGGTNVYGEVAFEGGDFTKPNKKYWQHVDYIVEQSAAKGLYLCLVPAWALNYVEPKKGTTDTTGRLDARSAYAYGKFIGDRYHNATNLVWMLGGDIRPMRFAVYDALAKGIIDGNGRDPDMALLTYHPPSRQPSSVGFCHDRPWLDFNLVQSGHDVWRLNYQTIAANYALSPPKPTADGEPCYENHPIVHKFENGVFKDYHLRMRAYWSLFSGAFGFTYGGNGVWQMDKKGEEPFLKTHANLSWDEALTLPGAEQMRHVRALMESRPFLSRLPDDGSVLRSERGEKDQRLEATFGADRTWAMVYATSGQDFRPNLTNLRGKTFHAWWFDPRTGQVCNETGTATGKPFRQLTHADEKVVLNPPGEPGPGNDWVLVLDDAAKGYPVPGMPPGTTSRNASTGK